MASIPETLIESELFGYEAGSFTGAQKGGKPGLIELAEGGTLFLDEIGEISPVLQSKLLRVLQDREVKVKQEVMRIAQMLDIDQLLDRFPSELSNGQRQRVALGRALIRNPEVYLMDEPLVHLDAKLRHQMRAELKEIQSESLETTTIYVTHDYREALSLGDRIAVINEGRIEQVGTPDEVYNRPASEFVAKAFGDPEMNIVDANLIEESGVLYLDIFGYYRYFPVPEDVRKYLMKHSFRSVRVGFRPKDIRFRLENEGSEYLSATVYSFEPLGATAILIVKLGDQLIRLISPAEQKLEIDQPIYLKFNTNRAIFFDAASGKFLTRSGTVGGKVAWQN